MKKVLTALAMTALAPMAASAAVIDWADWESYSTGITTGSASGTIGAVGVDFSGNVTFAQTGTGTNYWTQPVAGSEPYTNNSVVDNAPTPSEMIAMSYGNVTNTVTFSATVTDPIMAIVSQGQPGLPVAYDFDQSFTLLSEGRGYWGDGSYNHLAGDVLQGFELHSVVQFQGDFDSISWSVDRNEYWHGFTFGLADQSVGEPSTFALFALGVIGLGIMRRKIQ